MAKRKEQKKRPGVVFYFDLMDALEKLTPEQRGEIFWSGMCYARDSVKPNFNNQVTDLVWSMVKPRIDQDGEAYRLKNLKTRYAGYVSARQRQGMDPLDFEEWLERVSTDVDGC